MNLLGSEHRLCPGLGSESTGGRPAAIRKDGQRREIKDFRSLRDFGSLGLVWMIGLFYRSEIGKGLAVKVIGKGVDGVDLQIATLRVFDPTARQPDPQIYFAGSEHFG